MTLGVRTNSRSRMRSRGDGPCSSCSWCSSWAIDHGPRRGWPERFEWTPGGMKEIKKRLRCRTSVFGSEIAVTIESKELATPHFQRVKSKFGTWGAEVRPQGAEVRPGRRSSRVICSSIFRIWDDSPLRHGEHRDDKTDKAIGVGNRRVTRCAAQSHCLSRVVVLREDDGKAPSSP
jgi:hypothetical protein